MKQRKNVMADPVKFTEEEQKELSELQTGYTQVTFEFGKMYLERLNIEKAFAQLAEIEKGLQDRLIEYRKREDEWTKKMAEKYGDGSLDIVNGTFIPTEPLTILFHHLTNST